MTEPQGSMSVEPQFEWADDEVAGTGYTPQEVDALLSVPLNAVLTASAVAIEDDAFDDTESLYATSVEDPGIVKISAEAYGSDRHLREYWTHGKGAAKIRWGTPGDFKRCVRHLRKYVVNPEGLCNEYHVEAVGAPPGKGHDVTTETFALNAGEMPVDAGVARVGEGNPNSIAWEGVLAVEGVETGDGRMFANGSLTWPELPIPLMYQYETSHGGSTDRSTNVGNITEAWRDGNKIMGRGTLDLDDPYGMQAAKKMRGKYLNGVSIDADSVKDADVELVFPQPDPNASEEEQLLQALGGNPELTIFHTGRMRGATLVNLPAFVEASLNLVGDTSALDASFGGTLIASAAGGRSYTIEVPELPPLAFFEEPTDLPPIGAVWIEPNGHIFGLVGPSGVAHRAFKGKRVTIPMGNVDYTAWMNRPTPVIGHNGEVLKIRTGVITMNCGHLMDFGVTDVDERMRHYDNSCSIAAVVRVGESRRHKAPWIAGAIMPMSTADFQRFQACQLSGDWTPHSARRGWKEFVAALAVPVPGFARSTNVAAVRVDDNAVVVASSVPIRLTEATYDEVNVYVPESLTSASVESNRLALGRIRASLGQNHRQSLAAIRERVKSGATPLTASATPPKEKTVGCAPCAAAKRKNGETSAQTVVTVEGFSDGDAKTQAQQSAQNSIANSRTTSRG